MPKKWSRANSDDDEDKQGLTAFQRAQKHFQILESASNSPSISRSASERDLKKSAHDFSPSNLSSKRSQTVDSLANGLVAARISQWVQFDDSIDAPSEQPSSTRQTFSSPQVTKSQLEPVRNPFEDVQEEANKNPFEEQEIEYWNDEDSSEEGENGAESQALFQQSPTRQLPPNPFLSPPKSSVMVIDKPALPPRPNNRAVSTPDTDMFKPPLPARPQRNALTPIPSSSGLKEPVSRSFSHEIPLVYPEIFNASRKPPLASGCKNEFHIKGPVLCIASSRGYLVSGTIGGYKIWNLLSGECTYGNSKGAELKTTAICFLPSSNKDLDGRFFWVGFSDGDLWMVDVFTGTVLERRVSVHSHRILHILRCKTNMLTIDDNGILQVWTEESSRTDDVPLFSSSTGADRRLHSNAVVALEGKPKTIRIGSNQEHAVVINGILWTCKDRSIEILDPFQELSSVLKARLDIPSNLGVVSSVAPVFRYSPLPFSASDSFLPTMDSVYTGHVDGKIIEWDANTFVKRRLFDIGSYRIVSMHGISPKLLWISVGIGKIIVIDVYSSTVISSQTNPTSPGSPNRQYDQVTVIKEWNAEQKDTVEVFSVDPDSIVHLGQIIVAGSTKSGHVQIWDALFPEDFIDSAMINRENEFCEYEKLKLLICSWNIDANKPDNLLHRVDDSYFLDKWVTTIPEGADVFVFGLQELIDLESKSVAAKGILKKRSSAKEQQADHESRARLWRDRLSKAIKDNNKHSYTLLDSRNMVGLFTCVFVRDSWINRVSMSESITVSTGMGGTYGNKGAVITRFCIDYSSFCFITSHLPAHQNKVGKRNIDALTILKTHSFTPINDPEKAQLIFKRGGDGSQVLDHENIFFFGDLNYRIDLDRDYCIAVIERQDLETLLLADQLLKQRSLFNSNCILRLFNEPPIKFMPTYKYDPGTDTYDSSEKKRVPAYCDRILYRDSYSQTSSCLIDSQQRSFPPDRISPIIYKRFECRISDHRPIACSFEVTIKKPNDKQAISSKIVSCQYELGKRKQEFVWDANARWLSERLGADRKLAETVLQQCQHDLSIAVNLIKNFAK